MNPGGELEDERGVDRAAIRQLLLLTPAERVARLIDLVATWTEMRAAAESTQKQP
jgi:hypothetical protein